MKPLLVVPPASSRWPALRALLVDEGPPWLEDLERRFSQGVAGAEDAYAIMASGGQCLASAGISKCGAVGVMRHVFTAAEHRRRAYAHKLMEAVLSWFDMTGGKWLFFGTTTESDGGLCRDFGFTPLRQAGWAPHDRLTMLRSAGGVPRDPLADACGAVEIRELRRTDWPAMVALLQYRVGPDPRVPLEESAVTADAFTLDLITHQDKGACQLLGAYQGPWLVGLATVALDQPSERTYALLVPHADAPAELRAAVIEAARSKGYARVDFLMETLAVAGAAAPHYSEPAPTE